MPKTARMQADGIGNVDLRSVITSLSPRAAVPSFEAWRLDFLLPGETKVTGFLTRSYNFWRLRCHRGPVVPSSN